MNVEKSRSMHMQPAVFHYFPELQDDIVVSILAFVADCPFERSSEQYTSTLTHNLPLVCKKFREICTQSDFLWKIPMKRLEEKEPELWGGAMERFVHSYPDPNRNPAARAGTSPSASTNTNTEGMSMSGCILDRAGHSMRHMISSQSQNPNSNSDNPTSTSSSSSSYGVYRELFKFLLARYIRYTSPIFYMPGYLRIGEDNGLHFFEPRYRRLIRELMAPYPRKFREGQICTTENGLPYPLGPPTFIYANRAPLDRGAIACIVQVIQCHIYQNGTADVVLRPMEHSRIEQWWVEHDHLYTTRVMRLGKAEQEMIEANDIRSMHPNLVHVGGGDEGSALTALLRALGGEDGSTTSSDD